MHVYFTERFFVGAEQAPVSLPGKPFAYRRHILNENLQNPTSTVSEAGIGLMLGLGF